MNMTIYEPREDSWQLAEQVKKFAHGNVLELGTGSGFLAITAAKMKKVKKVIAVDINPRAIEFCKKTRSHEKILYKESNLFSEVTGKYDVIIFNPPYLPSKSEGVEHLALEGGKKGYEVIEKFLEGVNTHLKTNGIVLLLFSTLSKKKKVEEFILKNMLTFEKLSEQKFDNETLFVYKLSKNLILKKIENKKVDEISYFSKGKRGIILKGKIGKKKVAIKIKRPDSKALGRVKHEGDILKVLNKKGIGPNVIYYDDDILIREFIEGELLREYLPPATKPQLKKVLLNVFEQCRIMDKMKIVKEEMTRPYKHIIITNKQKVAMIDFERAKKSEKPHNVTQFCQYIRFREKELKAKGYKIDTKKLILLAKEYKHAQTQKNFEKIKKLIN